MEANEERTLGALRQHRREFFDPTVTTHGGRIFKVLGDGFLVEFGSVLNAARRAVEIQRGMIERNAGVPEDRHIKFRIGINLGDIIVDGDDFYGDGVNMAARLEGLAGPGGIACSAKVKVSPAQVAICLIDLKLARLARDPKHLDSMVDVAGYAACLREVTR
jgi:adenylate cyclase